MCNHWTQPLYNSAENNILLYRTRNIAMFAARSNNRLNIDRTDLQE